MIAGMTDRHAGYLVTLAADLRDTEAEAILNALRMVKGVVGVEPVVSSPELHIARMRVDQRWREKLIELVQNGVNGEGR